MQTPVFDFSNAVVRALGWTLIHSIWQGIAVALLTAVLLLLLQNRSAQARYRLAYGALMFLLAIVVYDFNSIYHFEQNQASPIGESSKTNLVEPVSLVIQVIGNQSFTEQCSDFFNSFLNPYLGFITLAWSIGFCFLGLQLAYGWWKVRGYQQRGGIPLDDIWQIRLRQFQRQFSNNRSIQLLEAAWTQVPLTIGWLKPIIFVPIGIVNRLQPNEVEAILAHELAHILKNDYFFNFLQAVVEVIFYYHPAVWWLSSVIRTEREMRCDDMAIAICGNNRLAYAKTLVQLQTQLGDNQANSKLALHFKKQPSLLFRRIQRIFYPPLKQSEMMDKMMITGLLLCGILMMAVAKNKSISEKVAPVVHKILNKEVHAKQFTEKNQKTVDSLPAPKVRKEMKMIIVTSDKGTDSVQVHQQIMTDTVLMPQTGKVRIIQSVQSESSNNNPVKDYPDKIIIGSMNEFRRNPEGWFTITKYRSIDGDTRIDTIHWDNTRIDRGKWDAKSVIVTENDPLLKTIETELKKDALIMSTRQYEFILNEKELNINGHIMDKGTYDKYKKHYKQLTTKSLDNGAFALTITKKDTISKGGGEPLAYSSSAPPPNMIPGHCYSMCKLDSGELGEWREILCSDKLTPEVLKSVIAKLKADGSLAAAASSSEFTKETNSALTAYQKKHKLPKGNLNLETVQHMGIVVK
jgi:beta-lactamase regulating signal transducer with metallopeptidase domain